MDKIYQLIQESVDPMYIIKKSDIHGTGIFAKVNLKKDTNLGTAFKKVKNTGKPDTDYTRTSLGIYTNHSNTPNIKIIVIGNIIKYTTLKLCKKGEELLLDYKTLPFQGERDFV